MTNKRLYRSRNDKMLAGVMAGVADYFEQDPTLWRIGYIVLTVLSGALPAALAYIVAALVIPEAPHDNVRDAEYVMHEQ